MLLIEIADNADNNIYKHSRKNNHTDINIERLAVFYYFVITVITQRNAPYPL
jgi:hypothetical protein